MLFLERSIWLLVLLSGLGMADTVNLTASPLTFFFETPSENGGREVPQCEPYVIGTMPNPTSQHQAVAPLYLLVIASGQPVYTQRIQSGVGTRITWTPRFPVGTEFSIAMIDSKGNSGGSQGGYVIGPGSSCVIPNYEKSEVQLSVSPSNYPCDEVELSISGGVGPYTVSLESGSSSLLNGTTSDSKFTVHTAPGFNNGADLSASNIRFFVTDSRGVSSFATEELVPSAGQDHCENPGGSLKTTGIIAGAVAGIFGGAAITLLCIWLWKKHQRKKYNVPEKFPKPTEADEANAAIVTPFNVANFSTSPVPHAPYIPDAPSPNPYGYNRSSVYDAPSPTPYSHSPLPPPGARDSIYPPSNLDAESLYAQVRKSILAHSPTSAPTSPIDSGFATGAPSDQPPAYSDSSPDVKIPMNSTGRR